MKLINGNEFTKISDFHLDLHIYNDKLDKNILNKNVIIFCKTDYLNKLFNFIKKSNKKYILITHNSDYPIDIKRFSMKPCSIKKWFGQNVTIYHPDLINIPIGLENKIRSDKKPRTNHDWFLNNLERFNKKEKIKDTIYCNWKPTHPSRKDIIKYFELNNIKIEFEKEQLSHKDYCEKLSNYKYIACPQGNGISTVRFWETLYMGSIPIVINHRIYRDYTLPFICVNNWSELTNKTLETFNEYKFSKEQLDFSYWENLIINEFNNL